MFMLRHHTTAVWIMLAVALALRLTVAVWVDRVVAAAPGRLCLIPGDAEGYWELGRKLAHGEPYSLYDPPRRVMRMPGFPLLLAACQVAFGPSVFAARCVLAIVGTAACGLVYWLGCELNDKQVALLAASATAVSPALVVFSPLLLSETAFSAALVASLIPWVRLLFPTDRPRGWLAAAAGALSAIATYMRPTWLPIAPLAAVVVIVIGRGRGARWCEAAIVCATLAACLAPWAFRNRDVTGHWVATTLWVGPSLYDGLNPHATGDSEMSFFDRENLLGQMSEYDMDQEYRRRAWEFAVHSPGRVVQLAGLKALRYWSLVPNAAQFQNVWAAVGLFAATAPLFAFSLVGLLSHRHNWRLWLITAAPVLFFAAVHLVFVGSIRYRLPAEYPLWILAASGALWWWKRFFVKARD